MSWLLKIQSNDNTMVQPDMKAVVFVTIFGFKRRKMGGNLPMLGSRS
jgi:hypothetical protein